jgi:hypothetical protein
MNGLLDAVLHWLDWHRHVNKHRGKTGLLDDVLHWLDCMCCSHPLEPRCSLLKLVRKIYQLTTRPSM